MPSLPPDPASSSHRSSSFFPHPPSSPRFGLLFFFSSRRRHTRSVSAFLLNRSSDLKGLLEGTLQAGTSAVSDKLLDLVGLGGKSAADKGKDTRDYLAAAFPELNAWERAGADASSAGMVDAG